MPEKLYETIRSAILLKLSNGLAKDLFYHGVHHTIDVEQQAIRIAHREKITSAGDLFLLKVGCLYHDTGFLFTYREHELAGCELAKKELPAFGLTQQQIQIICGLIMATKIPQSPNTQLEEIICDADLDYLGRDDFFPISDTLFEELKARNIVAGKYNWNIIQMNFFKQHQYCTATNLQLRAAKKQQHLEIIASENEAIQIGL
ncbi:HD domain-containing protein [Ferruginibacter paludis]|uniref:HD domain-containing protein n=1 Tax=Ferruginibacter paludis TaxID=1310417 RepID=UPI0025B334DC|nr:HD domain-containing protein [Ferruginibacter paludis]MDN3654625.1 HD domain-containing protein [Ferruginibacter paludis]